MNLIYADIIKIYFENNQRMAKVKANGVLKNVPLLLLPDAKEGDEILLCDGVPVSKTKGGNYVFSNSGQSA